MKGLFCIPLFAIIEVVEVMVSDQVDWELLAASPRGLDLATRTRKQLSMK